MAEDEKKDGKPEDVPFYVKGMDDWLNAFLGQNLSLEAYQRQVLGSRPGAYYREDYGPRYHPARYDRNKFGPEQLRLWAIAAMEHELILLPVAEPNGIIRYCDFMTVDGPTNLERVTVEMLMDLEEEVIDAFMAHILSKLVREGEPPSFLGGLT